MGVDADVDVGVDAGVDVGVDVSVDVDVDVGVDVDVDVSMGKSILVETPCSVLHSSRMWHGTKSQLSPSVNDDSGDRGGGVRGLDADVDVHTAEIGSIVRVSLFLLTTMCRAAMCHVVM